MARIAGVESVTVFESIVTGVRLLKREQDEGEQLLIHRLDDSIRGPRDADGSQHFDILELLPSTFGRINILA
jgi:hypothetical protein